MIMSYILSLLFLVGGEDCTADTCADADDKVSNVPYWGDEYSGNMYSGYLPIDDSCNSAMFYWFLEKEGGSQPGVTPVLLWLNGGPGASSIDGLLTENIGPYQVVGFGEDNSTYNLIYNEHAWTNDYNVLIIDNPVGTGYSYTDNRDECYASTEKEVAKDFYVGLTTFFHDLHPEYSTNPFYLIGESYAGKYIPNIAVYLMAKNFKFEGVIIGNGFFWPEKQYPSVPDIALNFGILNSKTYTEMVSESNHCVKLIQDGLLVPASTYCENFVNTIYSKLGGGVFRYDMRYFYDPTPESAMLSYLNNADVQSALHTTGHVWTDADESGPVSDALLKDFMLSAVPQLEILLLGGYKVILYNGQMDGSACNNVGQSRIVDLLEWPGKYEFSQKELKLWRLDSENVVGYRRVYENLAFVTITNAGHMVAMTQPKNYKTFLDKAVAGELAVRKKNKLNKLTQLL